MKVKTPKRIKPLLIAALMLLLAAAAATATAYMRVKGERAVLSTEYTQQARAEVEALTAMTCAGTDVPYATADFTVLDLSDRSTAVSLRDGGDAPDIALDGFSGDIAFARAPQDAEVVVRFGAAEVFRGTPDEYNSTFRPAEDGTYDIAVRADMENISAKGTATYAFRVTYKIVPAFRLSRGTVPQGGALLVLGDNLRPTDAVSVRVPFAFEPHVVRTDTGLYAYIPFNYLRTAGDYTIEVDCNGAVTPLTCSVTAVTYAEQHLVVDEQTESTTIGDTSALATYNDTIAGLDKIADDAVYWTGTFMWPCEGTVSTEFGAQRYINDAAQPSSIHAGIDIACDEGTPVAAANAGRVLYADFLQVSGWTVVIEHGGGLHTMYLHMSSLNCKAGDMVARGDIIGAVGQTGFATGPHLHFQASVGGACISPVFLFDGTSGVYDLSGGAAQP